MRVPTNGFVEGSEKTPFKPAQKYALTPTQSLAEWQARVATLSPREREVVKFVADGVAKRHIAQSMPRIRFGGGLSISIKTVEKYVTEIYRKLNVHDIATLTRVAVLTGIVPPFLHPTKTPKPSPRKAQNYAYARA